MQMAWDFGLNLIVYSCPNLPRPVNNKSTLK